jgi:hypothetical protein
MCTSIANWVCGAPKPRNAPFGRRVRHHHAALDARVRAAVGPGGVDDAAREHDGRQRAVGAAVHEHVHLHSGEPAISCQAGAMADDRWVALGGRHHVLAAVVDDLHRPAALQRQQAGMGGDHARILFLAAEAAARLGLDDADVLDRAAEQHLERLQDVVGTLERAIEREPRALRHGDDAVRLDVDVLLGAGRVRAFDHHVRAREAALQIPLLDQDVLEHLLGALGIEERLLALVVDPDACGHERLTTLVGEQENGLRRVPHDAVHEAGLVLLDQRDRVLARDVAVIDHREAGGVEAQGHPGDPAAGDRGADGAADEHAREAQVIRVLRGPGGPIHALLACDARAHARHPATIAAGRAGATARVDGRGAPGEGSAMRTPTDLGLSAAPIDDRSLSRLARGLIGSEVLRIAAEVRAAIASGREVLNLTVGDFDPREFPLPRKLADGIRAALEAGHTNYPPSNGVLELRKAIVEFYRRELGLDYPLESVIVAGGARPLIYATYRALVDPGESVVFPVPSWNNNHYAYLAGARAVPLEVRREHRFHPTADQVAAALPEARLVALTSPLNPTGTGIDPGRAHRDLPRHRRREPSARGKGRAGPCS